MYYPCRVNLLGYIYSEPVWESGDSSSDGYVTFLVIVDREGKYARKDCIPHFRYKCKLWVKANGKVLSILRVGNLVDISGYYLSDTVVKKGELFCWHYIEVEKIDARFAPQEKKDEIIARAKSKVLPNPEVMSQQESMWK